MSGPPEGLPLEHAIAWWEEEILQRTGNTTERFVALDAAGEFVHAKTGEADRVELSDEEVERLGGKDLVLVHNHPSGGGLTPADFRIACLLDLREIIAFGPRYRYRLARTSKEWPDAERTLDGLRQTAAEVRRALDARIAAGTMTPADASLGYWHEVWRRVTRRSADLRYTREIRSGS